MLLIGQDQCNMMIAKSLEINNTILIIFVIDLEGV